MENSIIADTAFCDKEMLLSGAAQLSQHFAPCSSAAIPASCLLCPAEMTYWLG